MNSMAELAEVINVKPYSLFNCSWLICSEFDFYGFTCLDIEPSFSCTKIVPNLFCFGVPYFIV